MKPNLLRAEFKKNGLTQEAVASILGISPKTLSTKLKKGVFGTDEANILIKELHITNPSEIFFD